MKDSTTRFWAKVDKTDGCWEWTASKINGYGQFWFEGNRMLSHRLSFELANGPIPEGLHIDHICHVRACVNPDHLRAVTVKQNGEHRAGPSAKSTTGVLGVYFHKRDKIWSARVTHNKKQHYVGTFNNPGDAEAAVIAKRLELFTHNNVDRLAALADVVELKPSIKRDAA